MSDDTEPYLFDVGVIALAHADTPVQENALEYIRDAVAGEINAIVPRTAVLGAHHVLRNHLGYSNTEASQLLQNFLRAKRIHWYDGLSEALVHDGLAQAGDANVEGWDGYYAQVAIAEGANTVLTIDADFERFDAFDTKLILSPDEFAELNQFLGN
jgi:predicted nucleic acid-binding protein